MVVAVTEKDGMKIITLSSPVIVENRLLQPIELCYQQTLHDETAHQTVPPGGQVAFPLGFTDNIADEPQAPLRRFRDLASDRYFYSPDVLDLALLLKEGQWKEDGILGYIFLEKYPETKELFATNPARLDDTHRVELRVASTADDAITFRGKGMRSIGYVYDQTGPGRIEVGLVKHNGEKCGMYTTDVAEAKLAMHMHSNSKFVRSTRIHLLKSHGAIRIRPADGGHKWSKVVRAWACTPITSRSEQLVRCDVAPNDGSTAAGVAGPFACALLSNNTSPVYTVSPVVRVSNKLPYDLRCVLVSAKEATPSEQNAVVIPANGVASVPFVAPAGHSDDMWSQLFIRTRLKDVEDCPGGGSLEWSAPVRVATDANLDHTTILGDLKDDHMQLRFVQGGYDYAIDLSIACLSVRRANLSMRHLIITCPITVHNEMGIQVDCVPSKGIDGHYPSIWRPSGASLEMPGLLGISTKLQENCRFVTRGRQSAKDIPLVLSSTMQFPLKPQDNDKALAGRFDQKVPGSAAGVGKDSIFVKSEDPIDVTGIWTTHGERGSIYRTLTLRPLIMIKNTTKHGMTLRLDVLSSSVSSSAKQRSLNWSLWLEAGKETALNIPETIADMNTKNQWSLQLIDPVRHSAPFDPYHRAGDVSVKFFEPEDGAGGGGADGGGAAAGSFLAVRVSTQKVGRCCNLMISPASELPPIVLANSSVSATVRVQQTTAAKKEAVRAVLMRPRVLAPMSQAAFAPDDATERAPQFLISVGDERPVTVKFDEENPIVHQYGGWSGEHASRGGRGVDVTEAVQAQFAKGTRKITVTPQNLGCADPVYGVVKSLWVEYRTSTGLTTVSANDSGVVALDGAGSGGVVTRAWYGEPKKLHVLVFNHPVTSVRTIMCGDSVGQIRLVLGMDRAVPKKHTESLLQELAVRVPRLGISLLDSMKVPAPVEVLYLEFNAIELNQVDTTHRSKVFVRIGDMQIDSSTPEAMCPICITRTNVNDSGVYETDPLLQLSRVVRPGTDIGLGRGFPSIEYISFLLQELDIVIDGPFINEMTAFADSFFDEDEVVTEADPTAFDPEDDAPPPPPEDPIHIEQFDFCAMAFNVTIDLTKVMLPAKLDFLKRGLGVLSLKAIPFNLPSVNLPNVTMTQSELIDKVSQMHIKNVIGSAAKTGLLIPLSLDIIGNPMGIFKNVGDGFKSIFIEPAKASVRGPEEFGKALGSGTVEFGKKIVGGAILGTVGTVTGAFGKFSAQMTFDDDYQNSRERNLAGPEGVGDGLGKGMKQFGKGLFDGVTGLVMQPIKEGKKGGFLGAMKGIGLGVVGLALKPVSGTLDLVSSSMAGVEAEMGSKRVYARRRVTRHISPTLRVSAYSAEEALAATWLREVCDGKYRNELFVSHVAEPIDRQKATNAAHTGELMFYAATKNRFLTIELMSLHDTDNAILRRDEYAPHILSYKVVPTGVEIKRQDSSAVVIPCASEHTAYHIGEMIGMIMKGAAASSTVKRTPMLFPVPEGVAVKANEPQSAPRGGSGGGAAGSAVPGGLADVQYTAETAPEGTKFNTKQIWENQRKYPLTGWGKKMLPTDRLKYNWGDDHKDARTQTANLDDVAPGRGWVWCSEWRVEHDGDVDKEGWKYAGDFGRFDHGHGNHKDGMFKSTRRRALSRRQMLIPELEAGDSSGRRLMPRRSSTLTAGL